MPRSPRPLWLVLLWLAVPALAGADPAVLRDEPTTLLYPPFWHTPLGIHRGTPELLAWFVGDRARFLAPEGLACTRLLSEPAPPPFADDCRVTVLGANSGQANLIYNPSLSRLEVLGDTRTGLGLFVHPLGVALFPDGTAYVADPGRGRVLRLRMEQGVLAPAGELAAPPGGWLEPWGVAFDSEKRLFVSDAGRGVVHAFGADGAWLRTYGPELGAGLRWERPGALAVADRGELWSYYRDSYLFVADQAGARLTRLDPGADETRVQVAAAAERLPAGACPARFGWLALDFYENLWVTDPDRDQVHKYDRHLRYLASYGGPGSGDGRFQRPAGVAIFRHFGQVFVAEAQGAHYFWIGTDISDPAVRRVPGSTAVELTYGLTEPSRLRITARPESGGDAETVLESAWTDSGPQRLLWRCPDRWRGASLTFTFLAEATYSSARYFAKSVEVRLPASP
jgi:sugar lactone lactonase YvrE